MIIFTVQLLYTAKHLYIVCSQFVLGRNSVAIKLSAGIAFIVSHGNFLVVSMASPMGAFIWGKVLNRKLNRKTALNFANIINGNLMSF